MIGKRNRERFSRPIVTLDGALKSTVVWPYLGKIMIIPLPAQRKTPESEQTKAQL